MRIYNSDGSEPEMCGNGIRCLAQFLKDLGEDSTLKIMCVFYVVCSDDHFRCI